MNGEKIKNKRIALDIDGVLANFIQGVIDRAKTMGMAEHFPKTWRSVKYWNVSPEFSKVMANAWMDSAFWLSLKPMVKEIPFEVTAYVTARPISNDITKQWLDKHGFPTAEVISVSLPEQKLAHLKELNVDAFVDDLYSTVREVREVGINGILYAASYQRGHKAECEGLPVIKSLEEIVDYV